MTPYTKRGRGILRGRDISWPFASITVEQGRITINVFGIESFTPDEVSAVQPIGGMIFGRGIRIHYTKGKNAVPTYASFYTLSSAKPLIEAITAAGFLIGTPKDRL